MASMKETLESKLEPEALMQERRDWDMRMLQTMQRMVTSPRTKKKVEQCLGKRQKTKRNPHKRTMIKDLTSLKSDRVSLEGGVNKETYSYKLLKKVKKKAQKRKMSKKRRRSRN